MPLATVLALLAFFCGQIAYAAHFDGGDTHDLSSCVACQISDRLDAGLDAPAVIMAAPLVGAIEHAPALSRPPVSFGFVLFHARGPPRAL